MIHRFQFCFNFAFRFNLRRYSLGEKAAAAEAAAALAAKAAAEKEERATKEYRASTVFKATPVPDYEELADMGLGPAVGRCRVIGVKPVLKAPGFGA